MSGSRNSSSSFGSSMPLSRGTADEARQFMNGYSIEIGPTEGLAKEKMPVPEPLDGEKQMVVATNLFKFAVNGQPRVYLYTIQFEKLHNAAEANELDIINSSGAPDSSFFAMECRRIRGSLFNAFVQKYPQVFVNGRNRMCFDLEEGLYSLCPLVFSTKEHGDLELSAAEVQQSVGMSHGVRLTFSSDVPSEFGVGDYTNMFNVDVENRDACAVRLLEIATSDGPAQNRNQYICHGTNTFFYKNPVFYDLPQSELGGGKRLVPGISKKICCIEGADGNGAIGVTVKEKYNAFYMPAARLIEMMNVGGVGNRQTDALNSAAINYLPGLVCYRTYGQDTPIAMGKLSTYTSHYPLIHYQGETVSTFSFFERKHLTTLQYPDVRMAIASKLFNGNPQYFPLELLRVAENQTVPRSNLSARNQQRIENMAAAHPTIVQNRLVTGRNILTTSNFLAVVDCQIEEHPIKVKAKVLATPRLYSGETGLIVDRLSGRWSLPQRVNFTRPSSVPKWEAILLYDRNNETSFEEFTRFAKDIFVEECRRFGLQMEEYGGKNIGKFEYARGIRSLFRDAKDYGIKFLLIGHPDHETELHPEIKALEQEYEIITQCVRTKTISDIVKKSRSVSGRAACDGLVAKVNVKCGGLNFCSTTATHPIPADVLFIGLSMCRGESTVQLNQISPDSNQKIEEKPILPAVASCLGFAANDGTTSRDYTGNFFFQSVGRQSKITVMFPIIEEILNRYKKNRATKPSHVIMYHDEVPDDQLCSVLQYEIPALRFCMEKNGFKCGLTVIMPSKSHGIQFFVPDQPVNPLLESGLVIDSTVVGKAHPEFFLNSFPTAKGNAVIPKFTVLYSNDTKLTMAMLQRWTFNLAYEMQTSFSVSSLPAPMQIAAQYARRGQQIFQERGFSRHILPDADPMALDSSSEASSFQVSFGDEDLYISQSKVLNYSKKPNLRSSRIAA